MDVVRSVYNWQAIHSGEKHWKSPSVILKLYDILIKTNIIVIYGSDNVEKGDTPAKVFQMKKKNCFRPTQGDGRVTLGPPTSSSILRSTGFSPLFFQWVCIKPDNAATKSTWKICRSRHFLGTRRLELLPFKTSKALDFFIGNAPKSYLNMLSIRSVRLWSYSFA